jgi:hypothetical protein
MSSHSDVEDGPFLFAKTICQDIISYTHYLRRPNLISAVRFALLMSAIECIHAGRKREKQGCRMAYFQNQKFIFWVNFGGSVCFMVICVVYFTAIWCTLWLFGTFFLVLVC